MFPRSVVLNLGRRGIKFLKHPIHRWTLVNLPGLVVLFIQGDELYKPPFKNIVRVREKVL
jgi:hypothetical protein